MKQYDHKKIEKKWQKEWEENKIYRVSDSVHDKENYYTLVEFTYPSGNLHVGHWYAFAVPDIFARYKRMSGFNVLYPMGFDAFGLPAENAAIKSGADPKVWTYTQMDTMRAQLKSMGAMFDWDREIVSCDPAYYKWTQWMFNEFMKKDLVYRRITKVNWCPKDQTILANEQVVDGKCERCGTEVVQRDQEQWMLRITKYADRLIDDLDNLDWPEEIKAAQRNWIGRSEGSEIPFKIKFESTSDTGELKVFTTRADTLFGATYMVLAPEHPWATLAVDENHKGAIQNADEVKKYIAATKKKSELNRQQSKEKTGVELKGVKAVNPANGEEIPIWIADYVLAGYGTGAIMAVPAHDERDFEFAKKYDLQIKQVIAPHIIDNNNPPRADKKHAPRKVVQVVLKHWKNETTAQIVWKDFPWKTFVIGGVEEGESYEEAAKREAQEETGYKNFKSIKQITPELRSEWYADHKDENRYAHMKVFLVELADGERGEMAEEEKAKHDVAWVPFFEIQKSYHPISEMDYIWKGLNEKDSKEFIYTGDGVLINSDKFSEVKSTEARKKITESVGGKMVNTYRLRDWGISRQRYWGCPIPIVYDPQGKAHPVPEEHLPWMLPTDVDHTPSGVAPLAKSKELFARTEKLFGQGWKPEVDTMDTFVDSSWYFYRYLDPKNDKTFSDAKHRNAWMPIDLYMGGAEHTTMHLLYSRFWVKAMHDLGLVKEEEAYTIRRNRGLILGPDGNKMSKSKGNVINPDEIVDRLGADTVRMYLAFMGPYGVTVNYPWDPNGVVGVRRFLERVWKLQEKVGKGSTTPFLHKVIKKMTEDVAGYKFNTAIAQMMMLLNEWEKAEAILESEYKILLQLLAPFAPHIAEELWTEFGGKESIHLSSWPVADESLIKDEKIKIAVQINGKLRGEVVVAVDASDTDIEKAAFAFEIVAKHVGDTKPKKVIHVKGRLINIVL